MRKTVCFSLLLLAAGLASPAAAESPDAKYVIANNTPRFVSKAQKVGDVDPSQVIDVTVWLTPKNRAAIDSIVAKQYDRASLEYHKWLDRATLRGLIAPSDGDLKSVADFLVAQGFTVVSTDKFNLYITVRGTAAVAQKAFNTTLAYVSFGGQTLRTNLSDPEIIDPAGANVMAVEGLDESKFTHQNIAQNAAFKAIAAKSPNSGSASTAAGGFSDQCIVGTGRKTFTTDGTQPSATYTGNIYNPSPTGCGYTPQEIQAAYGLSSLYNQGLNGTGQTIVIVDWCGSPTITADANAFSQKFGLPALTPSNFNIIYNAGTPYCMAPDPEINIDVEWAHAIAPGANIILLVPPTAGFSDIDSSWLYIIESGYTPLGNIVSNSYGSEEITTSASVLNLQNFILEIAAASGVGFNFSSGDYGDYTFDQPEFNPPSVIAAGDSPYATAVGGISLALSPSNSIAWQAAWGTNETLLAQGGFIYLPAYNQGFAFGSGGGNSQVFKRPSFQAALKGAYRHVPDISWLADPFTGAVIAISEPGHSPSLLYQVYGGTSLACPMFSALWAIAQQAAGADLGQAAPMLYAAPAGVITDIVPVGSKSNVTVVYHGYTGTSEGSAAQLAAPLETTKVFQSAIWNYPDNPAEGILLTFGTDSGLPALKGYDFATGLGVANPGALITYVTTPPPGAATH